MKKETQRTINHECDYMYRLAMEEYENEFGDVGGYSDCERLCSCQAWVYDTEHFYILRSYRTFIAVICKHNDKCYDMLRSVYGYTPTSAKHIAKFRATRCYGGYGSGKYGCVETLTWRAV